MNYPVAIKNLIDSFKMLPGIGEKTAERLALYIVSSDKNKTELFANSLVEVNTKISRCTRCNNFSDDNLCDMCKKNNRNRKILCVVEEPKNVILFEKMGTFFGEYHILGGLISPLDGINPNDLKIDILLKRIQEDKVEEIIFALKPSIEGETTILYITKKITDNKIKFTKIAHGVPIGADIDYVDTLTLEMAIDNRTEIK